MDDKGGKLTVPVQVYIYNLLLLVIMVDQVILAEIFWRILGCGNPDVTTWDVVSTFLERIGSALLAGGIAAWLINSAYGLGGWALIPAIIVALASQLVYMEILLWRGMSSTIDDLSALEDLTGNS
jgi:hypothetical protein